MILIVTILTVTVSFIHRAENTYQMLIMHIHPSLKVNNLNNI